MSADPLAGYQRRACQTTRQKPLEPRLIVYHRVRPSALLKVFRSALCLGWCQCRARCARCFAAEPSCP
jgi:hypothetical protein